jgi:nucleoside 2-deoxyribosyltransferase
MKIYISGPMTGIQDFNKETFEDAEKILREAGFVVVNPHKLPEHTGQATWEAFMRKDIRELCVCDAIVMLPGWHKSRGAKIEFMLAVELGLHLFHSVEEAAAWGKYVL